MTRQQLEKHQIWLYLAAVLLGLALGWTRPDLAGALEAVIWPALGLLLYATFTQVPLTHISDAFKDRRFMGAALVGNFVLIPIVVGGLLLLLPPDPGIRLGVLLVLLVPCTDWFITFTHLGQGDTPRAIAVTPVMLVLQFLLLPIYLWVFMGDALLEILVVERIAIVFLTLIVLPLVAAWLTERWVERARGREILIERLAWLPVPLLGVVVFLIAASQLEAVMSSLPIMGQVLGVFVAFLIVALLIGLALGRVFRLPVPATRTLIFSLGTRNSFVVLPLALALPPVWVGVAVVVVLQSLIELLGVLVYLRIVPRMTAAVGLPR
ncbi:arsenic resistance protein [Roseococcus microcysteis]|uniref:arsenic resistance protein n=1 Tax=Roseococcus microcysteis TaxID=2771361 RepID=UPI00168BADD6|nr:arsenic resistance protein [Roseococcus microcysteis]